MRKEKINNIAEIPRGIRYPASGKVDFLIFCKNGVLKLNHKYLKEKGEFNPYI